MPNERQLWVLFALMAVLLATVGAVAVRTTQTTTGAAEEIIGKHVAIMVDIERLRFATERESRKARSYLLLQHEQALADASAAEAQVNAIFTRLEAMSLGAQTKRLLENVHDKARTHDAVLDKAIRERRRGAEVQSVNELFENTLGPARAELDVALDLLAGHEAAELERARYEQRSAAFRAVLGLVGVAVGAGLAAAVLGIFLFRALKALKVQREALEASNRDLDAFAGRLAHDLRNVLSPLPLAVGTLRHLSGDDERAKKQLDRLDRASRRATRVMDGMLAFARAGRPPAPAAASVRQVVAEALEDLRSQATAADVTVVTELEDARVACEPSLLLLVVGNLAGNAIKFMEGHPERCVRLTARATGHWCELAVTDTGPGIAPEVQRHIFEPFFRAPGAVAPGTGIGLATVQRVVTAHGGTVELVSAPGAGCVFKVRLPLATPEGDEHADEPEAPSLPH